MNPQRELHLPPQAANDILREKIKDLERQVIAAESKGDNATVQTLHRERKRLRGILNGEKP